FQAEDGIRDFHVTGVQTCALPIFLVRDASPRDHEVQLARHDARRVAARVEVVDLALEQPRHGREARVRVPRDVHAARDRHVVGRSEERRGGKGWWWAERSGLATEE